jgi:hypothetical protein
MEEIGRQLQIRDWITIGALMGGVVTFAVTAWAISDIRSNLEQQIRQVPASIQQYQTQLKEEAAEEARTKKQNRKKTNR